MPPPSFALAIEMSNPSSGPRGRIPWVGRSLDAGPGVALGTTGELGFSECLDVEMLHQGSRHDDDLMPAIDRLCRRCGVKPADLARVAVSIGPGGYTSLRIAVATAKMLAEATGAAVVPVPSASVAAWGVSIGAAPAIVCLASKGPTCFGALLPQNPREGGWWASAGRAAAMRFLPPGALAVLERRLTEGRGWIAASSPLGLIDGTAIEGFRPRTLIADRFLPDGLREAATRVGASIVEPVFAPAFVLQIADDLPPVDPLALGPLYPREPEAVTLWRKRGEKETRPGGSARA